MPMLLGEHVRFRKYLRGLCPIRSRALIHFDESETVQLPGDVEYWSGSRTFVAVQNVQPGCID